MGVVRERREQSRHFDLKHVITNVSIMFLYNWDHVGARSEEHSNKMKQNIIQLNIAGMLFLEQYSLKPS